MCFAILALRPVRSLRSGITVSQYLHETIDPFVSADAEAWLAPIMPGYRPGFVGASGVAPQAPSFPWMLYQYRTRLGAFHPSTNFTWTRLESDAVTGAKLGTHWNVVHRSGSACRGCTFKIFVIKMKRHSVMSASHASLPCISFLFVVLQPPCL